MPDNVNVLPSQVEYKFFAAVEKSFDKAAAFTSWDPGILEQIKQCNAVYRMFARNRYRLTAQYEVCPVPSEAEQMKFVG